METKIDSTVKGTRIIYDETAKRKRYIIEKMIGICESYGYSEIVFPILQMQETFKDKVGGENQKMMYCFQDAGGRNLTLAPEYTAVVIQMAKTTFKMQKDVKLFYVAECFRGEKPQAGRYRQFTQFGVEVINPSRDYYEELVGLSERMVRIAVADRFVGFGKPPLELEVDRSAVRGLEYYKDKKGFEIKCNNLGAQKQIVGGGEYDGGIGFAIGVDRIMII